MTCINDALNLVIPMGTERDDVAMHVYHTPISQEVFAANYRSLSAAKSALAAKGFYYMMDSGPRIAALTLRDEGLKDAIERGELDVEGQPVDKRTPALLGELKRLTMILVPDGTQWSMLPVDTAIQQGKLDQEEWTEVESAIVFFTFHCAMCKKASRARIATMTASALRGLVTSYSAMEFAASLPMLTPPAISVSKAASSVPS